LLHSLLTKLLALKDVMRKQPWNYQEVEMSKRKVGELEDGIVMG
jgi:hypothetical protein